MLSAFLTPVARTPGNKGKLIGHEVPLSMQRVWSMCMHLHGIGNPGDLALFNLAIDA